MAKASVLLEKLASDLTNPDNEIILSVEHDQDLLNIVSFALVKAAAVLKEAAIEVLKLEPAIDSDDLEELSMVAASFDGDEKMSKYSDSIDNVLNMLNKTDDTNSIIDIANLATALDQSGDDKLSKVASVLDEILLTIGSPKGSNYTFKAAEEAELDKLRTKYRKPSPSYFEIGNEDKEKKVADVNKAIDERVKTYKPLEHGLSSRYCPNHNGVSLVRVGDNVFQCPLGKEIFNFDAGFTLDDGTKVPATSVAGQTDFANSAPEHVTFSTREDKLNG